MYESLIEPSSPTVDDSNIPPAVRRGSLKGFISLPSDPTVLLTKEQFDALFPPERRTQFIRDMVRAIDNQHHERLSGTVKHGQ
jgi:hypothetical protein